MKKSHFTGLRYVIPLLVCWLALSPTHLSAQTTCATAVTIPGTADTNMVSQSSSNTDLWYKFTASSLSHVDAWLYNDDTTGFTGATLYSGSCSALTTITSGTRYGLEVNLHYETLSSGTTYYLRFTRSGTSSITYAFHATFSVASVSPCVCPSSLYNPNNTCEAMCNGGFDYHISTLNAQNQVGYACPWSSAPLNTNPPYLGAASTDYLSADATTGSQVTVPNSNFGTENSHSNASSAQAGYGGIICYSFQASDPPNKREYLEAPLQYSLVAGNKYIISFWISLAENSSGAVNKIGAFVQSGLIYQPSGGTYVAIPAGAPNIITNSVVTTSAGWTQIWDTITANGGEDHIIIGQLSTDAALTVVGHTPVVHNATSNYAYYFIDDVSLVPLNAPITVTSSPVPACTNSAITLTASCSASSGNYSWSASSGTYSCTTSPCPTIATTATGATYTVTTTLPAYGNCTTTASYTPPTIAGPTSVNAGADQTVCIGGTATLTGSASGTYTTTSWANVNGTPLCSSCTSYSFTVTGSGQYVFTATNSATGCTMRDTMKITAFATPVHITSTSGIVTCDPNAIPFTTSPSGFSTYAWTTGAPTYSGQTTSTLSATWGNNYGTSSYVTVTCTTSAGCIAKDSIVVPACCKGETHAITNSSTSANLSWFTLTSGYYQSSSTFDISGIYHVDTNTRFINCTLKIAPNTKIIVDPGKKLEFDNAIVYACNDMWDGIYVDGTNSSSEVRVIHSTVIEDAKNAIVSTNGGKFTIDGSAGRVKMNKNYIGVYVKPYQGTHPGTIRKATISCDAPGQQGATSGVTSSGSNCKAPISGQAYCAIFIDSCSDFTLGDSTQLSYRNLLERQKFGVYAKNSNVKMWNNDVRYMIPTVPPQHAAHVQGIGVYESGTYTLTRTLTVGRTGLYKAHNKILKCSYGVMVENFVNLNCEYNRIDSITTIGVYALNNSIGRTMLINKDSITEFSGTGINCTNVFNSTVTITNNQLNETNSNYPTSFGYTGIYVANALPFTSTVLIQSNLVKRIRNGIWILNIKHPKVLDNGINFYSTQNFSQQFPAIGIKGEAAHDALIRNNTIAYINTSITTAAGLSGFYNTIFGIHITGCSNDTITKNTIQKCGSGIFLKGSDNPCLIGCNTMSICYDGINFGYLAPSSPSVYTSTQFRWGPSPGIITPTGNNWSSNNAHDLTGTVSPAINWYYNTSSSSPLPTGVTTTGVTITSTADTNYCYTLALKVAPGASYDIRDAILSKICKTPHIYDTLNAQYHYGDSLLAYRTIEENPSWTALGTADDTYYSSWNSTTASGNVGKLAAVEDSIKARSLANAATLLATITPNGTPESNRITVLGIYLNTWAKDSMTLDSITRVNLRVIANQAPVSGGIAVYQARAMLFEEIHDSTALRLAPLPIANGIYEPGHIYPNPTTGVMMLDYELPEGKTGSLQLYDITGRIVNSYPLVGGTRTQQFNANDVPAGLYFYTVFVEGTPVLSEKLIIIKHD